LQRMSGKRKKSSLSQSSASGSDLSDAGRQLEILASKKHKQANSGDSSGDSDGSRQSRSKSRSPSKSKSRSASGSDSGTAKSRSGSGSRSRSGSPASGKGSGSGSGSGSGKKSSSSDSGTGGSDGRQKSGSGGGKAKQASDASNRSSGSEKAKKLLKASERKASTKLQQSTLSNDSDSEEEQAPQKIPKLKKKSQNSPNESHVPSWRDDFDDGLDSDLVGDDDDRDNLDAMTEKQREEELFKRAERREELRKRFEISQKLKLQQKNKQDTPDHSMSSDNEKNTSSYQADFNQGRRKGYEEKHAKKFSALNNLKAIREEKEKKESQRKEKDQKKKRRHSGSGSDLEKIGRSSKNKKAMKASDIYSSSSSDGERKEERRKSSSSSSSSSSSVSSISSGESDTERNQSKKMVKKARVIETRDDLEKIRLSRFKIDKFVHLPIFKKTVVGCFVRIGIGHNKEKNVPVYRVAEIIDVCETAKVYDVMKSRTNIGLRMRFGKAERVFRAQFISNQPFTDTEFQKWRQTCEVEHVEMPTNQMVEEKLQAIQKALTYRFSSYDVDKILASKEKFSKHPSNYAMAKTKMLKEKGQADEEGNTELKAKLETQLADLEVRAEILDAKRTGSLSTISLINDRNRKDNILRAEKGIMREKRLEI